VDQEEPVSAPEQKTYDPHARITTPEAAQTRLDEIWTRTVAVLAFGKVPFLLRSEVGPRHELVDVGTYRVVVPRPTHASLERAIWPSLGQSISRDAKLGALPIPLSILPVETPRVLEWTPEIVTVIAKLLLFREDRIVVARTATTGDAPS
jgi:hypothetical protein